MHSLNKNNTRAFWHNSRKPKDTILCHFKENDSNFLFVKKVKYKKFGEC